MIILGIDPGYAIVGYGVIKHENNRFFTLAYGAIQTPAGLPYADRLLKIGEETGEIIRTYKPDVLSVEDLFFTANQKTGIAVAGARGVIIYTAKSHGLEIFSYTPLQVKQSVVGYGKAEKKQVIDMTGRILSLEKPPKLDDTSDALALAICHAHSKNSVYPERTRV